MQNSKSKAQGSKRLLIVSLVGFSFYLLVLFPFLRGIWVFPASVDLGFFEIRLYAVLIMVGILTASYLFDRYKDRYKDLRKIQIDDALIYTLIPAILGARIWYVLTQWNYYSSNLLEIFQIWKGGLVIFGGFIGGVLGIYLYNKKVKFNFVKAIELLAIFIPLAHVIGRFGNFVNQELYGPMTDLPWGQYIQSTDSFHHPAFLYEQIGNYLLFLILYWLYKKRDIDGSGLFIVIYLMGYATVRFFVDFVRPEAEVLWVFTPAQVTSIVLVAFGFVFFYKQKSRV